MLKDKKTWEYLYWSNVVQNDFSDLNRAVLFCLELRQTQKMNIGIAEIISICRNCLGSTGWGKGPTREKRVNFKYLEEKIPRKQYVLFCWRLNQLWPEPSGLRNFGSCYLKDWPCSFVSEGSPFCWLSEYCWLSDFFKRRQGLALFQHWTHSLV